MRDQQDICLSREWVLFPPLRGEDSGGAVQNEVIQDKIVGGDTKVH